MIKFRKLNADEIEARVSTLSEKGCSLLLYKDARVDQNLLDETVGAENWQRKHELIGNNLYCTVSIWCEDEKMWISKQDVGTESFTEKEKGQASDSFKRACFNWGIGRELYTAPFIWIDAKKGNVQIENGKNNKKTTYDTFKVTKIDYDESGKINTLEIYNNKLKKVVFTLGKSDITPKTDEEITTIAYPPREEMLKEVSRSYPDGSKNLAALLATFGIDSLDKATDEMLQAAYNKVHK